MKIISTLRDKWWILALVFIFLFSYYIRALNIIPDRLLSFDPIFQYRYTKYFVDWGHLPVWDELTYYTGRILINTAPPLMFYITGVLYWLFKLIINITLETFASYMAAIYGALIVLPAFFLVRELSNKYGGLLTAVLIGTAPQILVRTFGSSYDTDQIVLFFILFSLYVGILVLRKKTIPTFSLALFGFAYFMLAWLYFLYTFLILIIFVIIFFVVSLFLDKETEKKILSFKKVKISLLKIKSEIFILVSIFILLIFIGQLNKIDVITYLLKLLNFAQTPEKSIVNISIAELQPFNLFNLEGWILATGRFVSTEIITNIILIIFISFILFSFFYSFKKRKLRVFSFLLTLLIVGIYTTFRGIRFTEFVSALFLIIVGVGFGYFFEYFESKNFWKIIALGLGVFIIFIAMDIGLQLGLSLGPDINKNWDDAWEFLRTKTPEFSIVGTWWDPGHMITGLAERRVYADGAHCPPEACLYPINSRITDLGKIMATSDENESLDLIRKYQGDSSKVYWIASDDLIGKFQWLQYFGLGCDARTEQRCPLYIQIPEQSRSTDANGNIILRNYGNIIIFQGLNIPIPIYVQDINGAIFDEIMFYSNGEVNVFKMNESEKQALIQTLKPLEKQLNFRFTNQTIPLTVWVPQHYAYIVIIPPNLRNTVFTKMFMLEGQGLEHFKQVFKNEQVKIYEVI
jgi:asparagine N-glycosylation enzyme membrane subunit Stt3